MCDTHVEKLITWGVSMTVAAIGSNVHIPEFPPIYSVNNPKWVF